MSMYFRYPLTATGKMIPSLGGRTVRPRPLVPAITLVGPRDSAAREALLDTGADDTVFPDSLAAFLGIDLTRAPVGTAMGASGAMIPIRYADVILRLTDGKEQREWPATVAFSPVRLQYPLLGFAGCLQFFTATFHGDREEVELAVNALYPGI
jgi:hypothetical protein